MTHGQYTCIARAFGIALFAMLVLALMPIDSSLSQDRPPEALPRPTDLQLGVPVYPGAKYDGQMSGGMTQPDTYYWVFTTTDAVTKVAAFYKSKTGLTPRDLSGSYLFSIRKGESELFPDHGVMIEPNRILPAPAKTIITVAKKK